jgi:hypothetical protein
MPVLRRRARLTKSTFKMNLDNQRAQMCTALASQLIGRMTAPPPETVNVNGCQPMSGQVNTCIYPH